MLALGGASNLRIVLPSCAPLGGRLAGLMATHVPPSLLRLLPACVQLASPRRSSPAAAAAPRTR